jgi:hypothetical protein
MGYFVFCIGEEETLLFDVYNYFNYSVFISVHLLLIVFNTYFVVQFSIDFKKKFPVYYERIYRKLWTFFIILILIIAGRLGYIFKFPFTILLYVGEIVPSFMLMISFIFLKGGYQQPINIDSEDVSFSETLYGNGDSIRDSMIFNRNPKQCIVNRSDTNTIISNSEYQSDISAVSTSGKILDENDSDDVVYPIIKITPENIDKDNCIDQERGEICSFPYETKNKDSNDSRNDDLKFAMNQMMSDLGMHGDNLNLKSSYHRNTLDSNNFSMNSSIVSSNCED